jgi:hypothetical protein
MREEEIENEKREGNRESQQHTGDEGVADAVFEVGEHGRFLEKGENAPDGSEYGGASADDTVKTL